MGAGPIFAADAPPARAPRFGLLNAAPVVEESTNRWENGLEFLPEQCADGGVFDPCGASNLDPATCRELVETQPVALWAGDKRSAMNMTGTNGARLDDLRARARRQLVATESFHAAHELWTGTQAAASNWPNQVLADPASDVVTNGAGTTLDALACLEQYLGEAQAGQQGMIHATRQVVTHWVKDYLVTVQGGQLVTALGTVVVPDAGYTGSAPDGSPAADGSVWAYATGIVQVRLSPVMTNPPENDSAAYQVLSNTGVVFAWRLAAMSWDGCAHGAAEIDLDVCRVGGAS
jgi:hypothetical protein